MYQHQFPGVKSPTIPLSDLSARIEDMRPLTEGEYAPCVYRPPYFTYAVTIPRRWIGVGTAYDTGQGILPSDSKSTRP